MTKLSIEEGIVRPERPEQPLKARLDKQERAIGTRRKVLLGTMLLDAIECGRAGQGSHEDRDFAATLEGWVSRKLHNFLTRPVDRTLFPEFIKADGTDSDTVIL